MATERFRNLPPFAVEFLQSNPQAIASVRIFHQWLKRTYRPIRALTATEIEPLLLRIEQKYVSQTSRRIHRRRALKYFDWLHARGLLQFDPQCAWPRSSFPLPPDAEHFLQTLRPTLKLSTIRCFQTNLRQFHIWINAQPAASLATLDRQHTEAWLQWLHARGLHPATRLSALQNVRSYLYWLHEQGLLTTHPSSLIRRTDLPKLPQYLPRPIPPDTDEKLKRRLRKSGCIYQFGLLLMRYTGIRVGELINMTYDCIRSDAKGNVLLKVPLGKLDNERLVPLDEKTIKLVRKIQRRIRRKRLLLLETPNGHKTSYVHYKQALTKACNGLIFTEPMTTHRFRHTYATALLAGGMSLVGVMRLLGHRDYRMTLRYAAITDETVLIEYTEAIRRNEQRYKPPTTATDPASVTSPVQLFSDILRQLQKRVKDDGLDELKARILSKRIRRIQAATMKLLRR